MSFLLTQKHSLAWIFFASSVVNLLALTPMLYMLQIFDRVFISESVLTLLTISGVIIFFYVITTVGDYIRSGIMVSLGLKMDEELGKKIFQAALREKVNGQASNPFSLSDDFAVVKQWIAGPAVFSLFDIPWIPFYVVLMFVMHPILGYVSLGLILIFTLIGAFAARYLGNQEDYIRKEEQETNSFIYDRLKNEDIIDVHGLAKQFKLIWLKNKKIFYLNLHNKEKKAGKFYHFIKQFQTFSSSLALCVAAVLVMLNELTMATMIAASMLMMRVLSPVTSVVSALSKLSIVTEAISRIEKAIKELNPSNKKKIDYLVGASSEKENSNKILLKIDGVSFQYKNSEKSILNNISFSIGLGESFAVVGKTGAGKSTLGKILAGLYEDYQGTITVNDKELRNVPNSDFEKLIGYLPQEVMLFTGSISNNITGFKRPDSKVIIKVTKTVGIHEFILKQSSGYDTKLYGGTAGLSGGERQRIGLARAIYNHPRLVILDEPNSALDDSGEAALKHVIKYLKQMNISLLIITHKRSILEVVDKVITMENGEIKTILDSPVFIDEELKTIKLREGKD